MTRYRPSLPYPNAFSAFWYLIRFREMHVRLAAVLAILLCVIYSMGLGGLVLWMLKAATGLLGSEWSPDALSPPVRTAVGTAWVVFFTFVFMNMMFSSLLRPLPGGFLQLLRSRQPFNAAQVIRASEQLAAKYRSG
jgi:hypothetical protein